MRWATALPTEEFPTLRMYGGVNSSGQERLLSFHCMQFRMCSRLLPCLSLARGLCSRSHALLCLDEACTAFVIRDVKVLLSEAHAMDRFHVLGPSRAPVAHRAENGDVDEASNCDSLIYDDLLLGRLSGACRDYFLRLYSICINSIQVPSSCCICEVKTFVSSSFKVRTSR